ncbi:hypothetical protein QTV44_002498 [Vibrio vulnificus]|nr:hypothetical protein [Vibrio vulnificus]
MTNWCPLTAAAVAKPIVKQMVLSGHTVVAIKQSLRDMGIPVSGYAQLVRQGDVGKWRAQSVK